VKDTLCHISRAGKTSGAAATCRDCEPSTLRTPKLLDRRRREYIDPENSTGIQKKEWLLRDIEIEVEEEFYESEFGRWLYVRNTVGTSTTN
jgi:hypothetical protein